MIPAPAQRRDQRKMIALLLLLLPLAAFGASSLAGCYDFTYVEPAADAQAPDARSLDARAPEAGETGSGCTVGVESCGGDGLRGDPDILYRCLPDGGGALLRKCASGCVHDAGVGLFSGRCAMPVNPCKLGGYYCGGDKLDGDPAVLYTCGTGGTAVEKERCAKGCQVMKSPNDDQCAK